MGLKTMQLFSSYRNLCRFCFLSLFLHSSQGQQSYLNNSRKGCSENGSVGYVCDGNISSCESFVTFRSREPYNSPISIANLLSSEASEIASVNNFSSTVEKIPTDKIVVVPIPCTCSGNVFQHFAQYIFKENNTYYGTAYKIYQNLTTCHALIVQNDYDPKTIPVGAVIRVPVRCACPSENQTAGGVTYLLTHMTDQEDTATSVGKMFGVEKDSILEANMLFQDSILLSSTPILVPLKSESCYASPEMFFCGCSHGRPANGSLGRHYCTVGHNKSGFPVRWIKLGVGIGIGIGISFLCLFLASYKLYRYLKKRRAGIRKEGYFKQNGGLLLQEKMSSFGSSERAKLFTEKELHTATDNYNQSRFLGEGGYGTVYKGILPEGSVVAIKRSTAVGRNQIKQFINEVTILTQINHRNIVKLLGCCLETETPFLVYEFISNGTLYQQLREKDPESLLSWERRFNIACDVARALAYMHSAVSTPVFHRDIKSSNILLDDNYNAKVSDFGTSRSVPHDKTHLTTKVQGTLGYMDPEYLRSSKFTDKSDVYSFGVTLLELLTGENPYSYAEDHEGKDLVSTFISLARDNRLSQVLDPQVAKDAGENLEDIWAVAELATRCLKLNGKKRPAMKQVYIELESLRKSETVLEIDQEPESHKDEESCLNITSDTTEESVVSSTCSSSAI